MLVTLLLTAVIVTSGITSPLAHAQTVVATVPVGRSGNSTAALNEIAYDSGKGEVFVLNNDDDTVSVISDETNTVVATVTLGPPISQSTAASIVYDPAMGVVFAADNGNGNNNPTISVISDANNTVVGVLPLGANSLAYDSGKGELFVAFTGTEDVQDVVYVISATTYKLAATLNLRSQPEDLVYDPGKGEVFVFSSTCQNCNMPVENVSVISDTTNTVVANVTVGGPYNAFAYDPARGEVFVDGANDTISIISDATNTVIARIQPQIFYEGTVGGAHGPGAPLTGSMAYDSAQGELWVSASTGSQVGRLGIAGVISDTNNTLVGQVSVGHYPLSMAYDFGKDEVFVYNQLDDTVSVISAAPATVTSTTVSLSSSTAPSTTSAASQATAPVKTINVEGLPSFHGPESLTMYLAPYLIAAAAVVVVAALAGFLLHRRRRNR